MTWRWLTDVGDRCSVSWVSWLTKSTVVPSVTSLAVPGWRPVTSDCQVMVKLVLPAANVCFQTRVSKSAPLMICVGGEVEGIQVHGDAGVLGTCTDAVTGTLTML